MAKIAVVGDVHAKSTTPRRRLDDYQSTVLKKLDYVLSIPGISHVVFLGDVFDKHTATEELKNSMISLFYASKNRGVSSSTCIGNHDILYDSESSIYKTALGNLHLAKALTILDKGIHTIEDINICVLPYNINEAIDKLQTLENKDNIDIIIGHHFYEWTLCPNDSIMFEHIQQAIDENSLNAKIFLGHDHEPHTPETIDTITIYRPGSLLRTQMTKYALTQEPHIYIYDTVTKQVDYHAIPYEDASQIFDIETCEDAKLLTKMSIDIKKFLKQTDMSELQTVQRISEELVRIGANEEEIAYLKSIHLMHSLEF